MSNTVCDFFTSTPRFQRSDPFFLNVCLTFYFFHCHNINDTSIHYLDNQTVLSRNYQSLFYSDFLDFKNFFPKPSTALNTSKGTANTIVLD